jgi:putative ATPase
MPPDMPSGVASEPQHSGGAGPSRVSSADVPLAQRMRPTELNHVEGQRHFLNERFFRLLDSDKWTGLIFWGPPGSGKTTLATVIALRTQRLFQTLSAVNSGVKEIREKLERSKADFRMGRPAHILFIDEIHRLNKSQQDVLLPYLEEGSARFIGATTENPSFEINNAIASRCVIFHFQPLNESELSKVVRRAAPDLDDELVRRISSAAIGDARRALTLLEHLQLSASREGRPPTLEDWDGLRHAQSLYYDKKSEAHYDTISAFIKSIRGSDPDAAVYYLARMLEGGEDPLFIARRLIIIASEDVGNANPAALMIATSAFQAVHAIGMPEARIVLSQATTYLCCSDKSNRAYTAIEEALETVRQGGSSEIPMHIRNAPNKPMRAWGYGSGYAYPHDYPGGWVRAQYLPDELKTKRFYKPTDRGSEKKFQEFLKARGKSPEQS